MSRRSLLLVLCFTIHIRLSQNMVHHSVISSHVVKTYLFGHLVSAQLVHTKRKAHLCLVIRACVIGFICASEVITCVSDSYHVRTLKVFRMLFVFRHVPLGTP